MNEWDELADRIPVDLHADIHRAWEAYLAEARGSPGIQAFVGDRPACALALLTWLYRTDAKLGAIAAGQLFICAIAQRDAMTREVLELRAVVAADDIPLAGWEDIPERAVRDLIGLLRGTR